MTSSIYAGDDICSATVFSIPGYEVFFDNALNANSGVEAPPYGGYIGPDTWVEFVMPAGDLYLLIDEISMVDPAIAIYSGPCDDPTLLYNVLENNCTNEVSPELLIQNLNPGETYYLRVWPQNGSPNGSFTLTLSESLPSLEEFVAFADATIIGDCIHLTTDNQGQQGCAWYQIPIDFDQPFTHTMTANFGNDDGGADGICLVYQSNGQDYCGGTGQGIGAGGMPNSAIFEFDTYGNSNLNDPIQDHTSFNVNGDMNHNNSINGPFGLGDIEDGNDHTITFEWDPNGNLYALYFDGVLVFSGSYDFVNNCFGGNSTAFWGYTASTGALTNTQVICPEVIVYNPSTIDYVEVALCEGESYNGVSAEGYYTEFINGQNGCLHQVNFLVEVHDTPDVTFIDTLICLGADVFIGGSYYSFPAIYNIDEFTVHGCDSSIVLELAVLDPYVDILPPDMLTCENTTVTLDAVAVINQPTADITYSWSDNLGNAESVEVMDPGMYSVTLTSSLLGAVCEAVAQVMVQIDTMAPTVLPLADVFLDCSSNNQLTEIIQESSQPFTQSTWTLGNDTLSYNDTLHLEGAGTYIYQLLDTRSGCLAYDTVSVFLNDDAPTVEVTSGNLNCQDTIVYPSVALSADVTETAWLLNGEVIDDIDDDGIAVPGLYTLQATNNAGCTAEMDVLISQDINSPYLDVGDGIIPCDSVGVDLITDAPSNFAYTITGPQILNFDTAMISISMAGTYLVEVTDTSNHCTYIDTFTVDALGASPVIDFVSDTLDCLTTSFELQTSIDHENVTYQWAYDHQLVSTDPSLVVADQGWYHVEVVTDRGCERTDSIFVFEDIETPTFQILNDTFSCQHTTAEIEVLTDVAFIIEWTDVDGVVIGDGQLLSIADVGTYTVQITDPTNGCTISEAVDVITTEVLPDYTVAPDTLDCKRTSLSLPFTINNDFDLLQWTGPNAFQSDEISPVVYSSGEYHVFVQLSEDCTIDTSLTIHLDDQLPAFSVSHDSITCAQPQAEIDFHSGHHELIYTLSHNGGQDAVQDSAHLADSPGLYTVYAEGPNGCVDSISFEILAFTTTPEILISAQDSITCINDSVIISAVYDGELDFLWYGTSVDGEAGPTIAVTTAGNYTLHVTDPYGCQNSDSITISEYLDPPVFSLSGEDIYCDQLTTDLTIVTDSDYSIARWQFDGQIISDAGALSTSEAGTYYCILTNAYGCSDTALISINAYVDPPTIIPISQTSLSYQQNSTDFDIEVGVESAYAYDLLWSPSDAVDCEDCLTTTLVNTEIESLYAHVVDEHGCRDTLRFDIRRKYFPEVHIPNIFSPNGDNSNDFFTLYGNEEIQEIQQMSIYDRWGNLVSSESNFPPNEPERGWDGRHNQEQVALGVYVYLFRVLTTDGVELTYTGDVTVIR